ncbi:ATP-binding protein [Streptomyces sp. NPDC046887]|uniref:ATP-binding protein n=1 Tax=Streptomyces sp. NPDC046887 TaxID=3155472 RepID=UPI0033F4A1A9
MTTQRTVTDRDHRPATAGAARDQVRRLLGGAAAPLPAAVVNDVLLVTSELVTNALRHGGGLTAFGAVLGDGTITISVSDRTATPPRTDTGGSVTTPGGFGWPLVRRLSRAVAVRTTSSGKTIEAVVPLGPSPVV